MDNLQGGEIHLCAERLRHCGISTELKFHEFATKPDVVALLPTSHDCEDEEYVDGSAISPATVFVAGLVHRSELSVVVVCIYFRGNCSIDWYILNRSVISVVP